MAAPRTRNRTAAAHPHRRLVPVRVVVLVHAVAGVLWILASDGLADRFAAFTSIPRWAVEVGKGLAFVAITALVLHVLLRHRAVRLDAAAASGGNAAFETMSGYPSSVAVGATPRLLTSGAHGVAFYRELSDTILAGEVWRGQLVNRRGDGQRYTVRQTVTPVIAEDGAVRYFVAIQDHITEQVRAAEELGSSRVRLESLFDHALDAIVVADDQGRYLAVNPAVSELTGYSRDELLGMGPSDRTAPSTR